MSGTLVIHPGALGDVLLAVPALRALRRLAPDAPLTLAAQPRIGALLAALGVVDRAVSFDGLGLDACFVEDGEAPTLPAIAAAGRVVCWFGARDPVFVRRLRQVAPAAVVATPSGGELVWQHLRHTVGADVVGDAEPLAVPAALVGQGHRALATAGWDGGTPLAIVHPGAGGVAKRWSPDGFATALATLGATRRLTIVVHGGPADDEAVVALRARAPDALLLDRPSLPALAGALARAALYLGNDSGVSHLAATVGARSIVLVTTDHRAWRPWSTAARSVIVSTDTLRAVDLDAVRAAARAIIG